MILKESRKGLSVFSFKIPVKVNRNVTSRSIPVEEISRQSIDEMAIHDDLRKIIKDRDLDISNLKKVCFTKILMKE